MAGPSDPQTVVTPVAICTRRNAETHASVININDNLTPL